MTNDSTHRSPGRLGLVVCVTVAAAFAAGCGEDSSVAGPAIAVEDAGASVAVDTHATVSDIGLVGGARVDGRTRPGKATCSGDKDCPDGDKACQVGRCGSDGACVSVHADNTTACDDGNICTLTDTCVDGACQGGKARTCDDNNPCTDDACKPLEGCSHQGNTKLCNDGNPCTYGELCAGGQCKGGNWKLCDDANPCTTDFCDPAKGCSSAPNTLPCDDNNACTQLDMCAGGTCYSGLALACNDGNPCSDDNCDSIKGCLHSANTAKCDDGSQCTKEDGCKDGSCVPGKPADCDDGNPCTTSHCKPSTGCVNENNKLACSDNNNCTLFDVCQNGACVSGKPIDCDDGNPCTVDLCDLKKGCVHGKGSQNCDDDNACTSNDMCISGKCIGTAGKPCDDNNPCTADYCHPKFGCQAQLSKQNCDDGDICTWGDQCAGGKCKPGKKMTCNDGNPCTIDTCDQKTGCVSQPSNKPCNDGVACTHQDLCGKNGCKGVPLTCDDGDICTTDYCDALKGCLTMAAVGKCDDGNACTSGDNCQAEKCTGKAISCDDKNDCTLDTCDLKTGCKHAKVADGKGCADAGLCLKGTCLGGDGKLDKSCSEVHVKNPDAKSEIYWIDPDGKGGNTPFEVYCEMGYKGGGWTLVMTVSDDGNNSWTWQNKASWTQDKSAVGKLSKPTHDFKSPAYHSVHFHDMLFVHYPSKVWAMYTYVSPGEVSLAKRVQQLGGPTCVDKDSTSFKLEAGTLATQAKGNKKLCSTNLFFSVQSNNNTPYCKLIGSSWGPTWNVAMQDKCPFKKPGADGSLGPTMGELAAENNALGFGKVLGLNTGKPGKAENYMHVFVRSEPPAVCGDAFCDGSANENCKTCVKDCGFCPSKCGDAVCGADENCYKCPFDCGKCALQCGNGVCEGAGNENCKLCPKDCGKCPDACGNSKCEPAFGENCKECKKDCGKCPPVCGDSKCDSKDGESCMNCTFDCGKCSMGKNCGDGYCDNILNQGGFENCDNCAADCGKCPNQCGNGQCDAYIGEQCGPCPEDCGKCPKTCFNNKCEKALGETCANCPHDCGDCPPKCGDKVCAGKYAIQFTGDEENCETCPVDCGKCGDGCTAKVSGSCYLCPCETCVCKKDKSCCFNWTAKCVIMCTKECGGKCPLVKPKK